MRSLDYLRAATGDENTAAQHRLIVNDLGQYYVYTDPPRVLWYRMEEQPSLLEVAVRIDALPPQTKCGILSHDEQGVSATRNGTTITTNGDTWVATELGWQLKEK